MPTQPLRAGLVCFGATRLRSQDRRASRGPGCTQAQRAAPCPFRPPPASNEACAEGLGRGRSGPHYSSCSPFCWARRGRRSAPSLPEQLRDEAERQRPTSFSVGACFSRTASYPAGAYWVVVVFYFPMK